MRRQWVSSKLVPTEHKYWSKTFEINCSRRKNFTSHKQVCSSNFLTWSWKNFQYFNLISDLFFGQLVSHSIVLANHKKSWDVNGRKSQGQRQGLGQVPACDGRLLWQAGNICDRYYDWTQICLKILTDTDKYVWKILTNLCEKYWQICVKNTDHACCCPKLSSHCGNLVGGKEKTFAAYRWQHDEVMMCFIVNIMNKWRRRKIVIL